jgi:hypothetical protein
MHSLFECALPIDSLCECEVLGTPGLLRPELSESAVAAGEYSNFVFMIPSLHSNPQQIRNREFETVVFDLIAVLLIAGRRIL